MLLSVRMISLPKLFKGKLDDSVPMFRVVYSDVCKPICRSLQVQLIANAFDSIPPSFLYCRKFSFEEEN